MSRAKDYDLDKRRSRNRKVETRKNALLLAESIVKLLKELPPGEEMDSVSLAQALEADPKQIGLACKFNPSLLEWRGRNGSWHVTSKHKGSAMIRLNPHFDERIP